MSVGTGRIQPRWHTVPEVAQMLGYGLSKTKLLVSSGKIKSIKDGGNRRVMPEWVDEYIASLIAEVA
ncbi:helix-turn-helix domain-containing protein [Lentzea jiangxiensis]|uniref:DNA binding domain-containing protein, excisionase family n=1 Tax=Lentzea jiangxiensis TaxID=641025 RepID=A0A1H0ML35_9PSEU|nr:helix-turn-helix domain-containing protein [Lentzea jiangxiensis]SDO81173.1 DNA binding domain-containing protein, excisionase family [Lentzea jiangxiensis]